MVVLTDGGLRAARCFLCFARIGPLLNLLCRTNQRDATWRVNTAGALLMQFDVSIDLSIIQTDQTSDVLGRAKARLQRHDIFLPELRKQLALRGCHEAVTIDSEFVKIVDDVRPGNWDLQGLLIEGDVFPEGLDPTMLTGLKLTHSHSGI